MINRALYLLLTQAASISALVFSRVYTGFLPEGKGEQGAIAFSVSAVFGDTLDRVTGEGRGTLEVRCYDKQYLDAETIANAVRKVLQEYAGGTIDSTVIGGIVNVAVSAEDYDEDAELYSFVVDAEVIFREAS